MGAVRMRVQTADKNVTIIHTTPVHHLMSWEDKSYMFVKKQIHQIVLTVNLCLLKYEASIHDIDFSSEKIASSESGEKYAIYILIKYCLQVN